MSRGRFDKSQVRPNIRADIEERDRLQQTLTELSVKAMGADRFGEAKNDAQIADVIQELYHVQSLQERLESPTSAGNTDLKSIARTKQLLEERALEFKQKLQDCLSSFGSSQKEALPHLKRIQTLYRASNTAANESLDQKTRALQEAAQQKRERATLEAQQIFSDIEASHDRILEMTREWQRRNEMNRDAETLISRDEIEYFLEETLDGLDAEKTNIIQLKERLEAELPLSDLPVSEQTKALKTAKLIVKIIEAQIIIIQTQLDTLRRNRLKQDLTELSVKAMGADRFGEAKNETQITDVIEELYHLQSLQERMESPTSVDNPDLESIARTKQLLEERALEFNQKLQDCLSSFGSSQKEALPHLKRIQTLYRASNTAANETLDQKSQSLQVNMGRKKMAGASRSATKTRTVETDQLARKTTQERGTLDRPNINVEMEELARLQQDLVELSTGAMGAKNKEQILHLVQTLSVIQQMREALEAGHGKEILGSLTKQRAEELAREFKQELQSCLSSFSPSSQKAASKHLRQIQALYDSSTIALEEMIDKHAQSLQVDVKQRRTARVRVPERADLNTRKVDSNAEDRKDLQRIVVGFNMPPEFAAEINAGTESTPGEHLRFSARPGAHYELTALKTALDETGIFYEEKAKGVGNAERMLIIRQMPLLRPGFEAQFKQHYVAALKKIAAEAKAIRASQARSPQQLKHEEAARKISSDIQASYDRLDELSKKYEGSFSTPSFPAKVTFIDEFFYLSEEILDQTDVEVANMKLLKENLQTELTLSGLPIAQQEEMLQAAQNKIQEVEAQSIEARSAIEPTKELLAQAYNIPLPVKEQTEQLKRRQRTKDPEIADVAAEKIELLAEIKRIKGDIHNMVENLTNEIPKAMFSRGLKTEKRNTLLSLSRNLYVSDKSSLAELRECADKFRGELAKCKTDAVLRQGNMRKNCRTLIDNLSKDVESEQHVFRRPK